MVLLDLGDDFGGFAGFGRMIWVISQDLGGQLCHVTKCQDSRSRPPTLGSAIELPEVLRNTTRTHPVFWIGLVLFSGRNTA